MTDSHAQYCQFKLSIDPDYQCPHPRKSSGLCIFHLLSEEPVGTTIEKEFRQKFIELLESMEKDPEIQECDFREFCFPFIDLSLQTFPKAVDFSGSTFEANADFWGSTFEAKANFRNSTFEAKANFGGSTFEVEEEEEADTDFEGFLSECDFIALRLEKDAQITFEKVNLKEASFLDTNLERINFRDVKWHVPEKKFIRRKKALWDEFRPLKDSEKGPRDYEKIAENYRQLVLNYERKRDYETAEQFHVGEMEARRKKKALRIGRPVWKRKLREYFNAYYLYRLLNNYGTSYWQGLGVLVIFLLLFSSIFLCTGFKISPQTPGSLSQVIEYDVCWPNSKHDQVACSRWLPDYGEAILFTLSIVTFQRKDYQPVGALSKFWLYIAVFVLPSQAALVLLAIRRQFRR